MMKFSCTKAEEPGCPRLVLMLFNDEIHVFEKVEEGAGIVGRVKAGVGQLTRCMQQIHTRLRHQALGSPPAAAKNRVRASAARPAPPAVPPPPQLCHASP